VLSSSSSVSCSGVDDVLEGQRHRAVGRGHLDGLAAGAAGEVVAQRPGVAERGGHEQELHAGQLEQRHLPGPAALGVGVEVELVHDDEADVGVGALAQRQVGEDLRGAGDDRRVAVDGRVARHHPDVVGAELRAQREELLADQRLDRRGVEADAVVGQRGEVGAGGDERLARAGRGGQHDVRPADQLEQRLVLRRVEREALLARPLDERLVHRVRVSGRGDPVGEVHLPRLCPAAARNKVGAVAPSRDRSATGCHRANVVEQALLGH
jgi:hypothetical protein